MEVMIYARRTEDWLNHSYDSYKSKFLSFYLMNDEKKNSNFLNNIQRWPELYEMSYFEYRHCLKQISLESWDATGLNVVNYDNYPRDKNIILVPSDDDDWFAPNLGDIVNYFDDQNDLKTWKGNALDSLNKRLLTHDKKFPLSNCYAFRSNKVELLKLNSHWTVAHSKKSLIEKTFSMYIFHMGNFFDLQGNKRKNFEVLQETFDPKEKWYYPYYQKIIKLNKTLMNS